MVTLERLFSFKINSPNSAALKGIFSSSLSFLLIEYESHIFGTRKTIKKINEYKNIKFKKLNILMSTLNKIRQVI